MVEGYRSKDLPAHTTPHQFGDSATRQIKRRLQNGRMADLSPDSAIIDFHPLFYLVGVRGEVGWSHVALQASGLSYWMSRCCEPCLGPLCQGRTTFFLQHKNMHAKGVCSHYGFPWCWAPSHDLMATVDANVLLALVL